MAGLVWESIAPLGTLDVDMTTLAPGQISFYVRKSSDYSRVGFFMVDLTSQEFRLLLSDLPANVANLTGEVVRIGSNLVFRIVSLTNDTFDIGIGTISEGA